jgi:hypothetical protein
MRLQTERLRLERDAADAAAQRQRAVEAIAAADRDAAQAAAEHKAAIEALDAATQKMGEYAKASPTGASMADPGFREVIGGVGQANKAVADAQTAAADAADRARRVRASEGPRIPEADRRREVIGTQIQAVDVRRDLLDQQRANRIRDERAQAAEQAAQDAARRQAEDQRAAEQAAKDAARRQAEQAAAAEQAAKEAAKAEEARGPSRSRALGQVRRGYRGPAGETGSGPIADATQARGQEAVARAASVVRAGADVEQTFEQLLAYLAQIGAIVQDVQTLKSELAKVQRAGENDRRVRRSAP